MFKCAQVLAQVELCRNIHSKTLNACGWGEREGGGRKCAGRGSAQFTRYTTNYCKISESDTNIYLNLNVQVGQIG